MFLLVNNNQKALFVENCVELFFEEGQILFAPVPYNF